MQVLIWSVLPNMEQVELQNSEFWFHKRSKQWTGAQTPPLLSFNCQPTVTRLLAAFLKTLESLALGS